MSTTFLPSPSTNAWETTFNFSDYTTSEIPTSNSTSAPVPQPPRLTITDILMQYSDYRASLNLGLYGCAVLIAVGTITNILTILVMTRKTLIATSTCFYFALLGGSDLFVLYFGCLRRLLYVANNGKDIYIMNEISCHFMDFLAYFSYDMSSWIITIMTIDRFIAVRFPLKAASLCTMRNALIALALVAVVCLVKNCHFFFSFYLTDRGTCLPRAKHVDFMDEIWPWIDASFYSFLPFSILLVFNVLIIYGHRMALKRKRTLQAGGASLSRQMTNFNQRLTVVLLMVSFTFMVMTAPKVILICIRQQAFPFVRSDKSIDFTMLAQYSLVSAIFTFLMWTNHSINFFLYCLSGKRFRHEFLRMVSQCLHRKRHMQVFASGQPRAQAQGRQPQRGSDNSDVRRGSNSSVMSEYLTPDQAPAQLPKESEDVIARVNRWATVTFAERQNAD